MGQNLAAHLRDVGLRLAQLAAAGRRCFALECLRVASDFYARHAEDAGPQVDLPSLSRDIDSLEQHLLAGSVPPESWLGEIRARCEAFSPPDPESLADVLVVELVVAMGSVAQVFADGSVSNAVCAAESAANCAHAEVSFAGRSPSGDPADPPGFAQELDRQKNLLSMLEALPNIGASELARLRRT